MPSPLPTGWTTYTDPSGQNWPSPPTADPMTGAPTAPAPSPFVPVTPIDPSTNPGVQPAGPLEVRGTSYAPQGSLPGIPNIKGAADAQAAQGGPPKPPDSLVGAADRQPAAPAQPAFISQTTTDTSTTSQGVDKAGAAGIRAAGQDVNAAAQAGGQAQADQIKATGELEQKQARDAYGRGVNDYFQQAAALQVQDDIVQETSRRLEDTAKFKPDRTALFRGDTGALFGISAAISAMAGGWLMGQGLTGGKNPYLDSVMRMIDDNAEDQIAANSHVYQVLTQKLGSAQAAQKELKARMLGAVNDTIEAQSRFEKGELVQKGAAGVMAQVQAEQAKNRLDVEKAVARQTSTTVQRKQQMVANPLASTGGLDLGNEAVMKRLDKVGALESLVADATSLQQNGELANHTGILDEALDTVNRGLHNRSAGQKRVEDFKAQLQLINRADWASEPNGQEIQKQLSSIGIPENDAEIPVAVERLRKILNQVDPGGRLRQARRALGDRPGASETGRAPIVR